MENYYYKISCIICIPPSANLKLQLMQDTWRIVSIINMNVIQPYKGYKVIGFNTLNIIFVNTINYLT
ncbi:protein of unknown function [Clostridium beijerinckii]|nr:protein of unknown function [Clostridium beijerinckii]